MVQLKVMRRSIRKCFIEIEQLEKRALNDSVRDFYVRIRTLFMHKFEISYGDRRLTEKLLRLLRKCPVDMGMKLDQAIERKKAAKKNKTTTTKSIIRNFIQDLKTFAWRLENGLSETLTEENEKRRVRAIAQLASANLQNNSANKGLINAVDENIRLCQDICSLCEEMIIKSICIDEKGW